MINKNLVDWKRLTSNIEKQSDGEFMANLRWSCQELQNFKTETNSRHLFVFIIIIIFFSNAEEFAAEKREKNGGNNGDVISLMAVVGR